ncbi:MAG: energy-coupling factor ABC transporter ATP-binding protein, partial [Alphaproteobacteria bacterium]
MSLLEARDLHLSYAGGVQALSGVSVAVAQGRKTALLGANGSGKTTLLLCLAALLVPNRGQVLLDGEPPGRGREAERRWRSTVGMVFQDPDDQLFAPTVFRDVSFGPLNLGLTDAAAQARTEAALTAMRIDEMKARPVHMLSHGQKKRAAIAGALAMEPRILLLDEPTAGLDHPGTVLLLQALDRLAAGGTSIVFATHDSDLALAWADDVVVLAEGRKLAATTTPTPQLKPQQLRQLKPQLKHLLPHQQVL